jgi:hypothetical protein
MLVSDLFDPLPIRISSFHGRISTIRTDKGFENYFRITIGRYRIRILLNGKEHEAVTADPDAGTIEFYCGAKLVALHGRVEVRLERI